MTSLHSTGMSALLQSASLSLPAISLPTPVLHNTAPITHFRGPNLHLQHLNQLQNTAIDEAQRSAQADIVLRDPATPTEEELENMEAEEEVLVATAEKAKDRYSIKVRQLADLRTRMKHARSKAEAKKKQAKEERMKHLRNQARMKRQNSENKDVPAPLLVGIEPNPSVSNTKRMFVTYLMLIMLLLLL